MNLARHLECLSQDEQTVSSDICGLTVQSGRWFFSTFNDSMEIAGSLRATFAIRNASGSTLTGSICQSSQTSTHSVLILVMGTTSYRNGHHVDLVAESDSPPYVSTLEPASISGNPHSTGKDEHDSHHSLVATGDLIFDAWCTCPVSPIQDTTKNSASSSRPKHQRPGRESALVAQCLEHKVRRIEAAEADDNVTDLIIESQPMKIPVLRTGSS
jgi:hypothetical protein